MWAAPVFSFDAPGRQLGYEENAALPARIATRIVTGGQHSTSPSLQLPDHDRFWRTNRRGPGCQWRTWDRQPLHSRFRMLLYAARARHFPSPHGIRRWIICRLLRASRFPVGLHGFSFRVLVNGVPEICSPLGLTRPAKSENGRKIKEQNGRASKAYQ